MKVRINGKDMHVDNATGAALVAAGLAEKISDDIKQHRLPQPGSWKPQQPLWDVKIIQTLEGLKFLGIEMQIGNLKSVFFGDPRLANAKLRTHTGGEIFASGFGRPCPAEICDRYTKLWAENPDLRGTDVREAAKLVTG
jgi:hypothetical protein